MYLYIPAAIKLAINVNCITRCFSIGVMLCNYTVPQKI
jgi:hypothetical protein